MGDKLLVIDEGTTSTRAMLFGADGTCLGSEAADLTQHYPAPGLVEHDAAEIWERTLACARKMVALAGGAEAVAAIGITNQRETVVFWDRTTGDPLAPAIVWQDRRTASWCRELKEAGHEPTVQARTGLLLDPYFSGSKIGWAMANWPQLKQAGDRLAVGTIDSWLVWKLTGGLHITDATNASRTALMAIGSGHWDDGLIDLFDAPRHALPEIVDCTGDYGTTSLFGAPIAICGMAGDQQAATIGQACLEPGDTKATFGTGGMLDLCAGPDRPAFAARGEAGTFPIVAWARGGELTWGVEAIMLAAGTNVEWLRDDLGLIDTAAASHDIAAECDDTEGVVYVPALLGLGTPHWDYGARGTLLGSHPLLPAPHHPNLDPGSGRLEFEPVPGASTYAVRVALDADGTRLESSRRVNGPGVFLQARGSGPRYIFVRGIDALGIEGHDADLAVDTLRIGLRASDGTPVLGIDGTPVALD